MNLDHVVGRELDPREVVCTLTRIPPVGFSPTRYVGRSVLTPRETLSRAEGDSTDVRSHLSRRCGSFIIASVRKQLEGHSFLFRYLRRLASQLTSCGQLQTNHCIAGYAASVSCLSKGSPIELSRMVLKFENSEFVPGRKRTLDLGIPAAAATTRPKVHPWTVFVFF